MAPLRTNKRTVLRPHAARLERAYLLDLVDTDSIVDMFTVGGTACYGVNMTA